MQENLKKHLSKLLPTKSEKERYQIFNQPIEGVDHLGPLSDDETYLINALFAIGQKNIIRPYLKTREELSKLLDELHAVDRFYADFGGLVGYQNQVLKLLNQKMPDKQEEYFPPNSIDISFENAQVKKAILSGIKEMDKMAEMYAIGGAADRLNLVDSATGVPLPAAKLTLLNKTLLEHMIRDLFAREYLHFKLFGKQVETPLAMMTSREKQNDMHVRRICQENKWFGRKEVNFSFFCQPLVPTFEKNGNWKQDDSDSLLLKPGGHGVIWKLASQEKVIHNLREMGKTKALIRQINNPIAGTDYGLLAFTGIGLSEDQQFGFASCPRRKNAKEGVNVIKKQVKEGVASYALSNLEYCDLRADAIAEDYPANTNILFVDLAGIEKAVKDNPYPGVVLNFKQSGKSSTEIARLELTMQNIADYFEDISKEHKHSYLTVNTREKTISAAKKAYIEGESFLETPEGCILDMQRNAHALFSSCGTQLPPLESIDSSYFECPPYFITYHPALGPNYSIIRQKIKGGQIAFGSYMNLEVAELAMNSVNLDGSLSIESDNVMGHYEGDELIFSDRTSRIILENVDIENDGLDLDRTTSLVTGEVVHKQNCLISLGENAQFEARNVRFKGDFIIRVPKDLRCVAKMNNRKVEFTFEPIKTVSLYRYWVNQADEVCVSPNY
ncbi:MAG: UTP--glucose-1-phosphate uridylyltransferase [Rhabdochlamydiaceae bacterium]|nr:UTP--glucose-1-phosphate uridylyltransferase [Candidatus Amphrikana amoebophyrae]